MYLCVDEFIFIWTRFLKDSRTRRLLWNNKETNRSSNHWHTTEQMLLIYLYFSSFSLLLGKEIFPQAASSFLIRRRRALFIFLAENFNTSVSIIMIGGNILVHSCSRSCYGSPKSLVVKVKNEPRPQKTLFEQILGRSSFGCLTTVHLKISHIILFKRHRITFICESLEYIDSHNPTETVCDDRKITAARDLLSLNRLGAVCMKELRTRDMSLSHLICAITFRFAFSVILLDARVVIKGPAKRVYPQLKSTVVVNKGLRGFSFYNVRIRTSIRFCSCSCCVG